MTLSPEAARTFYDRFGTRQDWQHWYEDVAFADLITHGAFEVAESVFELGCGTGRLAERLLATHLPTTARYVAVDLSSTMVALARSRLARFGSRVEVRQSEGSPAVAEADRSFDRFISTYVFDLLSEEDMQRALGEARRLLVPSGRIGLVSLTHGATVPARVIERIWSAVFAWRPTLVGGCRPVDLGSLLAPNAWCIQHRRVVTRFGISSEVVLAIPVDEPS